MENRKQEFEELYNRYRNLVAKTAPEIQREKDDDSGRRKNSLSSEVIKRIKLAKELWEEYKDFVEALPSTEDVFKESIKHDYKSINLLLNQ